MKERKRGNFHVDKDLRGTHVKATLFPPPAISPHTAASRSRALAAASASPA